jgi:hypothetical protein
MAYFVVYYTTTSEGIASLPQNIILRYRHPVDWAVEPVKPNPDPYFDKEKFIMFWKEIPDYFLDNEDVMDGFDVED